MRWILISIVLLTQWAFGISGEQIFKKKCQSCHTYYIPQNTLLQNFLEHNNTELNLKAPTLNQLSFTLKHKIGDRKNDAESQQFEIENYLSEYLENPEKKKSLLPHEINRFFKEMPKIKLDEDEIEAVTIYIYEYAKNIIKEHSTKRYSYKEALKIAKAENKIILIYGYLPYCGYCIKMERRVMVEPKVKEALDKDFVLVKLNVAMEKLPLGLKRLMTPSFYFIDSDGKTILDKVEGYGDAKEFLEILEFIKGMKKSGS